MRRPAVGRGDPIRIDQVVLEIHCEVRVNRVVRTGQAGAEPIPCSRGKIGVIGQIDGALDVAPDGPWRQRRAVRSGDRDLLVGLVTRIRATGSKGCCLSADTSNLMHAAGTAVDIAHAPARPHVRHDILAARVIGPEFDRNVRELDGCRSSVLDLEVILHLIGPARVGEDLQLQSAGRET